MKRFILLIVILFIPLFSGTLKNKETGQTEKLIIIETGLEDYQQYLLKNSPLDRLYSRDGKCYFLVKRGDLKEIRSGGIRISSIKEATKSKNGLSGIFSGDINGIYHNYIETFDMLSGLEARYPEKAKLLTIGETAEKRGIYVIKISDNVEIDEDEPAIFIFGCHHAREWISVEVPILFAEYLLENSSGSAEISRLVNEAQIYILPLLNPDGLEYSIHYFRFWRKNRVYNGNMSWGVDLNRNYGHMWGYDDTGSSPYPESDVYRGPEPFSENETKAVRDFLLLHPPSGTISYHNFSQLILYPWGYTNEHTDDDEEMNKISKEMSERIFNVNGRIYSYGAAAESIYVTNGDTDDWIYNTFRIPAFTIELPPNELFEGGFFTSQEEIGRTFNENLPALLYFVNYFIEKHNLGEQIRNPGGVR